MTTIAIEVPGVPVAKARPRFARGRAYTTEATAGHEALIHALAKAQCPEPLTGPLRLAVTFGMPVPKSWSNVKQSKALGGQIKPTGKPDLDNLLKALDGLTGVVWKDDAQVVDITASKRYFWEPATLIVVRQAIGSAVVAPRYDAVYYEALERMNASGTMPTEAQKPQGAA